MSTLNWLQSSVPSHTWISQDSPKTCHAEMTKRVQKTQRQARLMIGLSCRADAKLLSDKQRVLKKLSVFWKYHFVCFCFRCFHTFSLKGQAHFSGTWWHSKGWVDQYGNDLLKRVVRKGVTTFCSLLTISLIWWMIKDEIWWAMIILGSERLWDQVPWWMTLFFVPVAYRASTWSARPGAGALVVPAAGTPGPKDSIDLLDV